MLSGNDLDKPMKLYLRLYRPALKSYLIHCCRNTHVLTLTHTPWCLTHIRTHSCIPLHTYSHTHTHTLTHSCSCTHTHAHTLTLVHIHAYNLYTLILSPSWVAKTGKESPGSREHAPAGILKYKLVSWSFFRKEAVHSEEGPRGLP